MWFSLWWGDNADIHHKYPFIQVKHDNFIENKSEDIIEYFESVCTKIYYPNAGEQWHNGLAESSNDSLVITVEPRLGKRTGIGAVLPSCKKCYVQYWDSS